MKEITELDTCPLTPIVGPALAPRLAVSSVGPPTSNGLPPAPSVERQTSNSQRPAPSVLVVDDEKSIRNTLQAFLIAEGYTVETAGDAAEGLRLIGEHDFDVVVSDIVLPQFDGIELLQAIRTAAPFAQVLMMTGEPTVNTAAASLRFGALDYLTKPVTKDAILRAVATAAQVKKAGDEKRLLEKENLNYQKNLEHLVSTRTQALQDTNQRLEAAMVEIRRTQEETIKQERLSALGQMVCGIAHDFNNALTPIVGLSSLFLSNPAAVRDPEQVRADMEAIRFSAAAAADIVRRLREFYRPEDALERTSVKLGPLVADVMLFTEPAWKVQAQAEGREIHIVNDLRDSPPLSANEPTLREALVNLVLNAVDAMPGGGTIRLRAEYEAESVILRISDTGTGMPDDVRKRCFEPFFTTKGKRGSGLGLAMVYGIVSRHGGHITVESEEGKGTTFAIRLPVAHRETTVSATDSEPSAATGPARVFKVLVVDDEEWARVLVLRFLTLQGHTVIAVATGHEALDTFRRVPVDLVITDRSIPDMSGDHIAGEIKRLSLTTPVIMLTGLGDIMNVRREKPAGVDEVIGKPITPDQLLEAVNRSMNNCGIRNSECGLRNAECGLRNAERGMQNAECGIRNAERGMQNAECGMRNADCGMRNGEAHNV